MTYSWRRHRLTQNSTDTNVESDGKVPPQIREPSWKWPIVHQERQLSAGVVLLLTEKAEDADNVWSHRCHLGIQGDRHSRVRSGGQKIGHVQDIMLDKLSDRLAFAIVVSNDLTSDGRRFLPLPWALLDYDASIAGYVVGLSDHQLKNAPAFGLDELTADDALPARELVKQFYNAL